MCKESRAMTLRSSPLRLLLLLLLLLSCSAAVDVAGEVEETLLGEVENEGGPPRSPSAFRRVPDGTEGAEDTAAFARADPSHEFNFVYGEHLLSSWVLQGAPWNAYHSGIIIECVTLCVGGQDVLRGDP